MSEFASKDEYYLSKIRKHREEIATLQKAQRWIPVGESLPTESQKVLSADKGGRVYQSTYRCGAFAVIFHCDEHSNVTHWRPLPLPPQEHKT